MQETRHQGKDHRPRAAAIACAAGGERGIGGLRGFGGAGGVGASVGGVLAAAAVIAGGTQAYAAAVRFDNPAGPGHFDWIPSGTSGIRLDVALSALDQPNSVSSVSGFSQRVFSDNAWTIGANQNPAGLEVGGYGGYFLVGSSSGELIPSGATWGISGFTYYSGFGGELPESQATYLGVRFDLGGGYQYGWIGVVRTGLGLDAFAWGYETEPGVPVAAGAPAPGTLAALAFGGAAAAGRKRRGGRRH